MSFYDLVLLKIHPHNALYYARQILLPDFDLAGQEALLNASVLIIGMGGLGTSCASYLVGAGLGQITIVDDDKVEVSNLHRQLLHTRDDIGVNKAISAAQSLGKMNPTCQINSIVHRLKSDDLDEQIQQHQLVIDCSDNLATRQQLNQSCFKHNKPLISGAAIRFEGQICTFIPHNDTACYTCLSSLFGEQDLSCSESGVMAPIVGIIGSMQALEAIKVIAHIGQLISGRLLMFDGKAGQWHNFAIPKHAQCTVCGTPHSTT